MRNGDPDDPDYFVYRATLRIHGVGLPLDEIGRQLGVPPTHRHRQGERPRPGAPPYRTDAWHLSAPVAEDRELTEHLRALWKIVEPSVAYLKALGAELDVFCGYRSNIGTAGFAVEPDALRIFTALDVPFGVSVIVDSWLGETLDQPNLH
jgi:hypothetical protein